MPTKDEILREMTFKEEGLELSKRVYYTLTADERTEGKLTAKALALLIDHLHKAGLLSESEIDELLFETAN